MPRSRELLGVDDGHAAVVGELPQIFGAAADADLDGALRIEHACKHRLAERAAVVELGALEGPACVAVSVDVHEPDRPLAAQGLQDRVADRVVAADCQAASRPRRNSGEERLNVLDAVIQAVAAAKGHVADVACLDRRQRREAVDMMIGSDALDRSHRPGPKRAPGRLVTPRSIGTPTSATSRPPKSVCCGALGQNGAPRNVATPS